MPLLLKNIRLRLLLKAYCDAKREVHREAYNLLLKKLESGVKVSELRQGLGVSQATG